jgi:hypothetical protein
MYETSLACANHHSPINVFPAQRTIYISVIVIETTIILLPTPPLHVHIKTILLLRQATINCGFHVSQAKY